MQAINNLTRRRELMAFISKAVECGFAVESFTSLASLLRVEVVETVIDSYWAANGETPSVYTIDLAWKLLSIARGIEGYDETALERLDEIRAELENYRQSGMTEKNRAVIRQVLTAGVWKRVLKVPEMLMAEAVRRHNKSPVKAAVLASLAVAIRILCVAPTRVGNLASIRIGENLIRPGGAKGTYWIVFDNYEVKNNVPLEHQLDDDVTELIDRYLRDFRPTLLRGYTDSWLFPGEDGSHKGMKTLSDQVGERVFGATGVQLTAHQFRHAAAAMFLKHRPGEYELVRQFLGHRSIITTTRFYAGLESLQASQMFGEIIADELNAQSAEKRRGPPRKAPRRPVPIIRSEVKKPT